MSTSIFLMDLHWCNHSKFKMEKSLIKIDFYDRILLSKITSLKGSSYQNLVQKDIRIHARVCIDDSWTRFSWRTLSRTMTMLPFVPLAILCTLLPTHLSFEGLILWPLKRMKKLIWGNMLQSIPQHLMHILIRMETHTILEAMLEPIISSCFLQVKDWIKQQFWLKFLPRIVSPLLITILLEWLTDISFSSNNLWSFPFHMSFGTISPEVQMVTFSNGDLKVR